MDSALTASDVALLNNDGFGGGNSFMWIFALLILANGGFGGWGNRGDFGQYATASSQTEILLGQQFDRLSQAVNAIGNGISSATYDLNNRISDEGRAIQTQLCGINSNIDNKFAALEKSQLEQRIAEQSQQISQLQMAQMMCGVPKINNNAWGVYPYAAIGCNCNNNI